MGTKQKNPDNLSYSQVQFFCLFLKKKLNKMPLMMFFTPSLRTHVSSRARRVCDQQISNGTSINSLKKQRRQ